MESIVLENTVKNLFSNWGLSLTLLMLFAEIYGVETRDINKAVANNPDKFTVGYIVELSTQEKSSIN
jgi:hypothetical protein